MFAELKGNGKLVEKCVVYQIGMTLFGTVLYIASTAAGQSNAGIGTDMKIITSIFSVVFYLVLLYTMARDEGLKDQIRIEGGRMERRISKFIYVSVTANITNIIFGLFIAVVMTVRLCVGQISDLLAEISYVVTWIIRLTEGMYFGIWNDVLSRNAYFPIIMVVPSVLVCMFGYAVGTRGGLKEMLKKK